ncbi:hypothetical protein AAFF_G00082620 [Aldrovandia affinis]|uniref:Gasdermin pore forming domain-containing protein n=1 Tax=Aldrovandia affinis TaxID=143900 RepID=A0AAD7T3Y9_9TELE|nr:hypothetical protein AAFF_G00082620 [Aldrovandia affinis]
MFQSITEDLVKHLDSNGELIPIASVIESSEVDVLSIVKIVKSSWMPFFKRERYRPTEIKLQELLQSGDTVDFGETCHKPIGDVDMYQEGQGIVGLQCNEQFIGDAEVNMEVVRTESTSKIEVETVSMSRDRIHHVLKNSTVNEEHYLIQKMKKSKQVMRLAVVYKVLKVKNPVTLRRMTRGEGHMSISACSLATMFAGGRVANVIKLKLEAGCVLGFGVYPLPLTKTEAQLEEGCLCTLNPSPLDKVPEGLRLSVQHLLQVAGLDRVEDFDCLNLLKPLGLLVGTLADLGKETVTLIMGLDSEVRGQVAELVEAVLERVCSGDGGDLQWSERFSRNTVTVADGMLMSCGLNLGEDLGSPGAPDVALLALYIALQGIGMLFVM